MESAQIEHSATYCVTGCVTFYLELALNILINNNYFINIDASPVRHITHITY